MKIILWVFHSGLRPIHKTKSEGFLQIFSEEAITHTEKEENQTGVIL